MTWPLGQWLVDATRYVTNKLVVPTRKKTGRLGGATLNPSAVGSTTIPSPLPASGAPTQLHVCQFMPGQGSRTIDRYSR